MANSVRGLNSAKTWPQIARILRTLFVQFVEFVAKEFPCFPCAFFRGKFEKLWLRLCCSMQIRGWLIISEMARLQPVRARDM